MSEQQLLTDRTGFDAENGGFAVRPYCVDHITSDPVDPETVVKAQNGDDEAFSKLFWQTYRYVFGIAKRYLRRDEDIYDAIQDTYTNVYANLGKLKAPEAFVNWVGKIAVTCSRTMAEKMAAAGTGDLEDEELVEIDDTDGELKNEVVIDVTAVLSQLDPADAELLTYVYYDRLRVTEIARMQGVPATTVYSRLNAAKRRLKEQLKIRGIEKAVYGGDVITLVTTALRNAIGTNLLSAAVAEEILHSVTGKKTKAAAVVAAVARKQRNAAVLRIASYLLAAVMLVFGLITVVYYAVKPSGRKAPSADGLTVGTSTEVGGIASSGDSSFDDTSLGVSSFGSSFLQSTTETDGTLSSNEQPTASEGNVSTGTSGEVGNTGDPDTSGTSSVTSPSGTTSSTTSSGVSLGPTVSGYYTYTVTDSMATITDVSTSISGDITIPSTLGGYPVTTIDWEAFMDCTELTSVIIPNGVTRIWVRAFKDCVNLKSVSIPPSVTHINTAFGGCESLESVHITDLVA